MVWSNKIWASFVLYVEDLLSSTVLLLLLLVPGALESDPLPLGWGAVIVPVLPVVVWVKVTGLGGESWLKLSLLSISPL